MLVLLALCLHAAHPATAAAAGAGVQVDDLAAIVAAAPAPEVHRQSADLLRKWMRKLYGDALELPFVEQPAAEAASRRGVILLGSEPALLAGMVTQEELDLVAPGGYIVACDGSRIAIAGADRWCTRFGAVAFLERLGIHFLFAYPFEDRNVVPESPPRRIEPFRIFDRPVLPYRTGHSELLRTSRPLLADPRNGATPELFRGDSDLWIDHSSGYLVPKALYGETHPEYYPLKGDKRVPHTSFSDHRTPLCLSNPELIPISIHRALAWVDREPDKQFFCITYGDTYLNCYCPACRRLDGETEPKQMTSHGAKRDAYFARRYFHWVNAVARAVAKQYPSRQVITFAYAGSTIAPEALDVADNVWVGSSGGLGNLVFWDHTAALEPERMQRYWAKNEAWLRLVPDRLLSIEYASGQYEPAMLDTLAARLREYDKRGMAGVFATYGNPSNFPDLWRYVWARLCWDPYQDPREVADVFIRHYYGAAAPAVSRFFQLSHERYAQTLEQKMEMDAGRPVRYYEPGFVRACSECLVEAADAVAEDARLRAELHAEEGLFLGDVVHHLPSYDPTPATRQLLVAHLDRRRALAGEAGKKAENELIADIRALGKKLEQKHPGYEAMLEDWLKATFWWLKKPEPAAGKLGEGGEQEIDDPLLEGILDEE